MKKSGNLDQMSVIIKGKERRQSLMADPMKERKNAVLQKQRSKSMSSDFKKDNFIHEALW